jgi:hypothetical protein
MTPAVLDRPASLFANSAASPVGGGQVTLEERLDATLHALLAAGEAGCPVCDASMTRARDGGVCAGCGSRLS